MIYLWFPIFVFLIFVVFAWWAHSLWPNQLQWLGKLDDLEKLLPAFLIENPVERTLNLSVQRRRARIWVDFYHDHIVIKLPLATTDLLHRKKELIGEFEVICGQAIVADSSDPKKSPVLEATSPIVSSEKLASTLREVVKLVYRTDDNATMRFAMTALPGKTDEVKKIAKAASNADTFKNVFLTFDNKGDEFKRKQRNGCLFDCARLLLFPVAFIFAFYHHGLSTAIIVQIGSSGFAFTWNKLRHKTGWFEISNLIWFMGIGFALLTYLTGSKFYIQFGATVYFVCAALRTMLAFARGEPIFGRTPEGNSQFSGTGIASVNIGIVLILIAGAGVNELLRTYGNLEVWVWFFAFINLELTLLSLLIVLPLVFYASKED